MAKNTDIELGDIAQDMITGYTGVVVAFSVHLTGCDRFTLQAPTEKNGKLPDAYGFDITTLKLIKKGAVKPVGREIPVVPRAQALPGGPHTRVNTR